MLKPTLLLVAACATLTAPVVGQTLFDDFTGTSLDLKRWSPYRSQNMSVGNSRLKFNFTAIPFGEQVAGAGAYDGFLGDFDFIVDFDQFNPRMTRGEAAFEFYITDLTAAGDGSISTRIVGDATSRMFVTEMESKTGGDIVTMRTGAGSGQFRVQRTGAGIAVMVHPAGQSWQLLKLWPNVLTPMVQIEIDAWCGDDSSIANQGTLSVNCDKITYTGKRYPGAYSYGSHCGVYLQRAGIAYIGNPGFVMQIFTGASLGGDLPIQLILGTSNIRLDLTPFGAPGCFLNTDLLLMAPVGKTNSSGEALISLAVPNDLSIVGSSVNVQAAVRTNTNAFGYVTSNALGLTVVKL